LKSKDKQDTRNDDEERKPSDPNSTNPPVAKPVSETESPEASKTDVANAHEELEKTASDSDVAVDKTGQQRQQVSETANDNNNSENLARDIGVLGQGTAGQNSEATETENADDESNDMASNSNLSDNEKRKPSDPNSTNPPVNKPVSETESPEASKTDVANAHEELEKTASDSDVADKPGQQRQQVSETANDNNNSENLARDIGVLGQGTAGQNSEATETENADDESNDMASNSNLSGV
jgi:DNA-directed RNA polymerase specialized sigma subunit